MADVASKQQTRALLLSTIVTKVKEQRNILHEIVNGRRTGLVTFCVETAFYNGLLKERLKGDRSDRKTRKKT
jgi:hypothetical protein